MTTRRSTRSSASLAALALAVLLASGVADAQPTDFCGCAGSPDSLGDFVASDPATYPAGSQGTPANALDNYYASCDDAVLLATPPDGVFVFDSFTLDATNSADRGCRLHFGFVGNQANTPITILVKGDVTLNSSTRLNVSGLAGGAGSSGGAGAPGQGGPGGFAGGEGAYQLVNFATIGGNGIGPGGGLGSTLTPGAFASGGIFVGTPELRPLLGSSGGGGGRSDNGNSASSGGGGGGGGGALLIAANGTITINGQILSDGGVGGNRASNAATSGAGGAGGAIRLLANRIQGGGSVFARGGNPGNCCDGLSANAGLAGRIRMEAIFNTFSAAGTDPVAVRAPAPGPLVNPITPTVRITSVDGGATPANPVGFQNSVDMLIDAPGVIQIGLATTDVPVGTDVEVKVKPKVGGAPVSDLVTLAPGACSGGACNTAASFDLPAGAYVVEARATFQTPP
jgi:hypothetical protein